MVFALVCSWVDPIARAGVVLLGSLVPFASGGMLMPCQIVWLLGLVLFLPGCIPSRESLSDPAKSEPDNANHELQTGQSIPTVPRLPMRQGFSSPAPAEDVMPPACPT